MKKIPLPLVGLLLAAYLAQGCSAPRKIFKVNSYPQGATIYVDGEKKGLSDMEKLQVTFGSSTQAILRLEKEGYQPTGTVLKVESNEVQFFPLQESPNNLKIIQSLNNIQRLLDRYLSQSQPSQKDTTGNEQ